MPRRNLKQATQDRAGKKTRLRKASTPAKKAAKSVAKKAPNVPKALKNSTAAKSGSSSSFGLSSNALSRANGTRRGAITEAKIPGLPVLVPEQISAQLPTFNPESYRITDPLKPNPSIPQVSQVDYDSGEAICQGGIRAAKLTGLAFDLGKEVFTTVGKQAKAFGAGIKAATAIKAVEGDYYDYLSQVETTDQKSISLSTNIHRTDIERDVSIHTQSELDEKLSQAEIAADLARAKTQEKQSSLNQFKSQLGSLVAAK
jgi:hypothetical protein